METKHTKREWKIVHTPESGVNEYAVTSNGVLLATVLNTVEQCEANAKLIAAAPELLEALTNAKIVFDKLVLPNEMSSNVIYQQIINAINKATE